MYRKIHNYNRKGCIGFSCKLKTVCFCYTQVGVTCVVLRVKNKLFNCHTHTNIKYLLKKRVKPCTFVSHCQNATAQGVSGTGSLRIGAEFLVSVEQSLHLYSGYIRK